MHPWDGLANRLNITTLESHESKFHLITDNKYQESGVKESVEELE